MNNKIQANFIMLREHVKISFFFHAMETGYYLFLQNQIRPPKFYGPLKGGWLTGLGGRVREREISLISYVNVVLTFFIMQLNFSLLVSHT